MDLAFVNIDRTFVYLDVILIITKGEKSYMCKKILVVLSVLIRGIL